jgi:transcriptional regulator with XRE-family HTH domain
MNHDQLSLLRELLRAGLSQAEVARRLGVSRQRISQIVRKEGLAFVRGKPSPTPEGIAAMRASALAGGRLSAPPPLL